MLVAYLRERFRPHVYVPLAIVIAGLPPSVRTAAFAVLLLLQFRLWDDLADRAHDAVTHPDRALVRAPDVRPLIALCLALAVLNVWMAVWHDPSGISVAVLAALEAIFAIWYLARTGRTVLGDHLLLAKYPAMVVVVAGSRVLDSPFSILGTATAVYLAACAYEAWHDRSSPLARYLSLGGH